VGKKMKDFFLPIGIKLKLALLALLFSLFNFTILAQEEPLLPLPDPKTERESAPASEPEVLIPLPGNRLPNGKMLPPEKHDGSLLPLPPKGKKGQGLIPPPPPPDNPEIIVNPKPPAQPETPPEIVINPEAPTGPNTHELSNSAPRSPQTQQTSVPQTNEGKPQPLPAFPKDTSSAVFMLMKSWQCDSYDGKALLEHAINVYGQEAEDKFIVKGLENLPKFNVTLKEDDITLDEMFDILANKNGFDWGVDIPGKTIYFYPGK